MDPAGSSEVEAVDPVEARSKRPPEDDGQAARKRARGGDVKRVAEIVLVLSAMAAVRGGRTPTEEERAMMAEARAKVVAMCEELAPKDILPREVIGGVIEDLGIGVREQKLGFRPPKISIAEKLLLTKRKMEESKEFVAHSATYSSQRLQSNFGCATESRGAQHNVRAFLSDKPGQAPISSGGFQPASPLGHVSAATSTPLPYQLPSNEVRSSSGLASSNLGRDPSSLALLRVERTHFRLDGKPNGSSYAPQVQGNSSVDHTPAKTPTWSLQPQSISSTKIGSENKVHDHIAIRVEGTADISSSRMASQATRDQNLRSFVTHSTPGHLQSSHQLLQGNNIQPPSLGSNHNEIGKIVQKLLHPQLPQHPTWAPPSRDYMNKAVTCQICKLAINEVDSVLLCDACEKGYHLKCLQAYNHKGIPRGEWHCPKCLSLSGGKPLPPKYGRVMRNMNTPKAPPTIAGVMSSSDKKVGMLDQRVNQQKITVNGNSDLQGPHTVSIENNHIESASDSRTLKGSQLQANNFSSSIKNVDDKPSSETYSNNSTKSLEPACCSLSIASSNETYAQHIKISESSSHEEKLVPKSDTQVPKFSVALSDMSYHVQASHSPQDADRARLTNYAEIPSNNYHDNHTKDSEKSYARETSHCNLTYDIKQDDQAVERASPVGTSGTSAGAKEHTGFSSDGLHGVEWVGNALKVVDEKIFYQSCHINGVSYKVLDHALFRSSNDKLIPSKLQGMWEDSKTRSKWVIVNQCYFPSDLPEVVGRPSAPENNEVYESNHDSTIMAGLIQGPCEVVSPDKFKEESERRMLLRTEANDELQPIFLCKWFYDKFNGLFQPVSS